MFFFSKPKSVIHQAAGYAGTAASYIYAVGGAILGVFSMQNLVRFLALSAGVMPVNGQCGAHKETDMNGNVCQVVYYNSSMMYPYLNFQTYEVKSFECTVSTKYTGKIGIKTKILDPSACMDSPIICETYPEKKCTNKGENPVINFYLSNATKMKFNFSASSAVNCWDRPNFAISNEGCTWKEAECEDPYENKIDISCLCAQ